MELGGMPAALEYQVWCSRPGLAQVFISFTPQDLREEAVSSVERGGDGGLLSWLGQVQVLRGRKEQRWGSNHAGLPF